jgi:hypothetical protein
MLGAAVFLPCLCSRPARSSTIQGRGAGKAVGSDGACMNGISPLGKRKTNTTHHATSAVAKNIVPPPSHSRGSCSNQFTTTSPFTFRFAVVLGTAIPTALPLFDHCNGHEMPRTFLLAPGLVLLRSEESRVVSCFVNRSPWDFLTPRFSDYLRI